MARALRAGRDEELDTFVSARDERFEIEALELLRADDGVVLGVRRPELRDIAGVELYGQIRNVFAFCDGAMVQVWDYRTRGEALAAAGIRAPHWI